MDGKGCKINPKDSKMNAKGTKMDAEGPPKLQKGTPEVPKGAKGNQKGAKSSQRVLKWSLVREKINPNDEMDPNNISGLNQCSSTKLSSALIKNPAVDNEHSTTLFSGPPRWGAVLYVVLYKKRTALN